MLIVIVVLSLTACAHNVIVHKPSPGEIEEINQYMERLCWVYENEKQASYLFLGR